MITDGFCTRARANYKTERQSRTAAARLLGYATYSVAVPLIVVVLRVHIRAIEVQVVSVVSGVAST